MVHNCKSIIAAAKNGHGVCLKTLIEAGADLNIVGGSRWTALHYVIHYDHTACVKMLIDAGANIDIKDNSGCTPLHRAVFNGHDACVKLLVEAGANLDVIDDTGTMPLHHSAYYGYDACVKTLIEAGASLNIDGDGYAPLHYAVYKGHDVCVKLLVNKIVSERPLRPSELRVIPQTSAVLGDVLRTTMQLHGRTEAAKITAHLHVDARDTMRTAMLCLNRTMVPRDLIDSIVLQCV
ncbi:ankyrin repeat PH and SEC7 domain containing protein [Paramecium bursaria Chlorella virus KS1B]|nr:ankyrin repeat PH and SEC7 domain containing protein [Paramecium bursaria Chlorella virus KS1B]AGE55495.1 ankyrin repeat PH and SEC7 domain containing protein [Paramecium bursaria Chlorella virus MA1E]